MGTEQSKSLCGRTRHAQSCEYTKKVSEFNGRTFGKLILDLCGNEGCHGSLSEQEETTLRFLRAANSFVPDAKEDGADLRNVAFILRQPGKEFVVQAGNGDWEFDFSEDAKGEIYGRCVRKPLIRYFWDKIKNAVVRLVAGAAMGFLSAATPLKALQWFK